MPEISDPQLYLERMSKPLQEKLKIAKFISPKVESVIDIGCADGTITIALANMFPKVKFLGVDFNKEFIDIAKKKSEGIKNVSFEYGFLRERLAKPERYDSAIFCSVLHEFYSYGEGISTVVKALADAHEIIKPDGNLIIRDMILYDYVSGANLWLSRIEDKIKRRKEVAKLLPSFEECFGKVASIKQINHFLLKYMYENNWEREGRENYVPVSFEQYDQILELLGMKVQFRASYTIPYLRDLWKNDFSLTEDELSCLRSTGIIVAEK